MKLASTTFDILFGLVLAFGLAFAAPAPAHAADEGGWSLKIGSFGAVKGSGKVQTESRAITGFQAIALRGSMKLVLRQGTREGVQITGDDNVLPLVETKVVSTDGVPTLEIGMKRGTSIRTESPLTATIDLTTLSALSISGSGDVSSESLKTSNLAISIRGSGDIRMKHLDAGEVAVKVAGSGDIELAGRASKLQLTISGSGDFDSRALDADDVNVRIAGSGDAVVNARKTLDVSIAGNGEVRHAGDAVVTSHVSGHGKIRRL